MSFGTQGMFVTLLVIVVQCLSVNAVSTLKNVSGAHEVGSGLRIYLGVEAKLRDFPYVVRLETHFRYESVGYSLCTGALIHISWVLSASHCTSGKQISKVQLKAGLVDEKAKDFQSREAKKWIFHPKYRNAAKPFVINEQVQVVPLSHDAWPQNDEMYNRVCIAAGWGDVEQDKDSSKLRFREAIARHGIKGCKCQSPNRNKMLVCLDHENIGKVCQGDSGGALVCDGHAVGVVSYMYHPEECNSSFIEDFKYPKCHHSVNVYMYICPELKWIGFYVPGTPLPPKSCRCSSITLALPVTIASSLVLLINIF